MKNNKKGFIVPALIIIVALLAIGGGVYLFKNKKVEAPVVVNEDEKEDINNKQVKENNVVTSDNTTLGNKEDLVSFSVKAGDTVSGVLKLSGVVKNGYFFEGNIEIHLLDSNQKIQRSGNGMSSTEWMTTGPVSFTASIDSLGLSGPGFIMIRQDDPSGGEGGPAKKILIPVIFKNESQKTMSVKLYFPNRIFNPQSFDCSLVYPVTRIIPETQAVASATLSELIKGPTIEEQKNGYFSSISEKTKINSIKITNGILYVDFNKEAEDGGGSCGQTSKGSSINKTLMQFPTVKSIKMSIENISDPSRIFQP